MPVFDAHVHIFPLEIIRERDKIARKDKAFGLLYGDPKAKMIDVNGLSTYMKKEGIKEAVVLSFPFKDKELLRLANDYLLYASREFPVIPFIMIDIFDETWSIKEIERCFSKGAVGIGEIAIYEGELAEKELSRLDGIVKYMEETGGPLLFHVNEPIGHKYRGKTKVDFVALFQFVEKHQNLKLILSHLGGGICFFEFMPEVKNIFRNVFYDIAAVPFIYDETIYNFIGAYIPEKVFFGSDYPLLPYSRYKNAISKLSVEKIEKILFRNAERFFKHG